MDDALEARSAVDLGRLMQLRIDTGKRGNVDDGRPAHALPHAGPDEQMPERGGLAEQIGHGAVEERLVGHAHQARADVEGLEQDTDQNHRGNKVRDVGDGLDDLLVALVAQGVQTQR